MVFRNSALTLLVLSTIPLAGCQSQEERAQSFYERGMKLVAEHNEAKAALEYRNAVRLKRDFIEAWKALAEIDQANKDWRGAIMDLRTIVELRPDDVSDRLKLGKLLLLTASTNEALDLAKAGLDRDDRNAGLHALRAAVSLKLNDRAGAIREAQIALQIDHANADALMVLAVDRLEGGDSKGALSLLEDASFAENDNVSLQLLKIKLFEQTGDFNNVEAILKKLVDQNPRELGYRKLLANFYAEQHRIDDGEAEMRAFATANPSDSAAALELVRFLFKTKGAPAEARNELNNRIKAGGDIFPFKMALADMDFTEGDITACKQLLQELIGNAGTPERVQMAKIALARMYVSRREFDLAETLTNDILQQDSHNASVLTIRAIVHLERSQPDAAVPDLVAALAYRPRSVELMSLLATAYERSGLTELADKQFADATRASAFDPRIAGEYASFLERRGGFARAEEILVELMKRQPENIQVMSALAQLRLARRNWSGAQEIAESLRRKNESGSADQILGEALIGQGQYADAIAPLKKAYQANPDGAQPINALISAFLKANRKDEALSFLNSVVAKRPGSTNALVLLGSMQLANGEVDRAIASYSDAIRAQPKDPIGYQALADLYQHQKNYDKAVSIVRKAVQEQPDLTVLHLTLANALEQNGDYDSAISQYESVLDKQPGNLVAANNLASLLLDRRTDGASLQRAQSIAAMLRKSQVPQFKDTLGWAKYRQGDYVAAASLCEEAVAVLPDQALVRYHLGMAYAALSQTDKASEQLKKALELAPTGPVAEAIRITLKKITIQQPIVIWASWRALTNDPSLADIRLHYRLPVCKETALYPARQRLRGLLTTLKSRDAAVRKSPTAFAKGTNDN